MTHLHHRHQRSVSCVLGVILCQFLVQTSFLMITYCKQFAQNLLSMVVWNENIRFTRIIIYQNHSLVCREIGENTDNQLPPFSATFATIELLSEKSDSFTCLCFDELWAFVLQFAVNDCFYCSNYRTAIVFSVSAFAKTLNANRFRTVV